MAGTGMSRRTFYKLKPGMNDFIARMELARQERETNGPDLDRLLP